MTWKCLRTTVSDSPKLRGGSQHFPVQSSTQPSVVSTGWVPACFHSETIEQYPLVRGEKKENQCDSCEQIWRWWASQACETQNASLFFSFFLFLNLANFKAVIANLMHELCDTLSHGEMLRCLSACQAGVLEMITFKDGDCITHHTNFTVELSSSMKTTRKPLLINNNYDYNTIMVAMAKQTQLCTNSPHFILLCVSVPVNCGWYAAHTPHSSHKHMRTHDSACQVLISSPQTSLWLHLAETHIKIREKVAASPHIAEPTHSCPCIFCVLFNGPSISSVQLNVLVENYLGPGSAADIISIHTVYCELLAVLVAEPLWSETWLLATKSLSF